MARIVVLGAGIAGHTAARHLHLWLAKEHEIVVISPNPKWNWIPSNIWVGVGQLTEKDVTFDLAEIYKKTRIDFHQAKGLSIHPEGNVASARPYVTVESTSPGSRVKLADKPAPPATVTVLPTVITLWKKFSACAS